MAQTKQTKQTRKQLKAQAALNLDLFQKDVVCVPAPATLYTLMAEQSEAPAEVSALADEHRQTFGADLPTGKELYHLFDRYNWMYFGGRLERLKIEYSNRMRTAGAYFPVQRLIRIGRKYHELFPEEVADTLKHEMIHLLHLNHGAQFKTEAARIGATVRARSHPSLRRPPKYVYWCPGCETEYPRQKRLVMASCGSCSTGGKYEERFKLKLKRSKNQN
jgi:predicted SprT family Zn-dependent metalloprotease